MSKIIEQINDRDLCHIVAADDGNEYYIDSCLTYDGSYENAVFPWRINGERIYGQWKCLIKYLSGDYDTMVKLHQSMCSNLEEYLAEAYEEDAY